MHLKSRTRRKLLFAILSFVSFCGPQLAVAQNDSSGDADVSLTQTIEAVIDGDAAAQFTLGLQYYLGRDVPQDYAQAAEWIRRAAELGHVDAQYYLGVMYVTGQGVPQDDAKAVVWLQKAAEQGNTEAQYMLGNMYAKGQGVPLPSYAKAVRWYRKAAEQGKSSAQFKLGMMYTNGRGVSKDDAKAVVWFHKAAEQGDAEAQYMLGVMYANGIGVAINNIQAYAWFNIAATTKFGGVLESLLAEEVERAAEAREKVAQRMTREEIAEAQQFSAAFPPLFTQANPTGPSSELAEPAVYVFGSGFFITSNGYFVTNNHVIADAQRIRIMTDTGTHEATVVRTDPTNDLALLKVTGTFPALFVRGSRSVRAADRVATIGFPNPSLQGLEPKYGSGVVSSITGPNDDPRFFQISVPIQPGNSGGPLLDASGAVVGVVAAKLDQLLTLESTGSIPENVGYAIKGTILLGFMESVPNLLDTLSVDPGTKPMEPAELAEMVNDAIGMVIVER